MKYTMSFRERVVLNDGTKLQLRAIQPSDKAGLVESFARLSPESRRSRFHAAKAALSVSELRFLTECDGERHYAIIATCNDDTGEQGVGVARFVRSDSNPAVAELGITVADTWQRRGVGSLLLQRIVAAAAERRIERLQAVMLADNKSAQSFIGHNLKDTTFGHEDDLMVVDHAIDTRGAIDHALLALRQLTYGTMIIPLRLGEKTLNHFLSLSHLSNDGAKTGPVSGRGKIEQQKL